MTALDLQKVKEIKYVVTLTRTIAVLIKEDNTIQVVNDISTIQPLIRSYPSSLPAIEPEWQLAIKILKHHGYEAKVFCETGTSVQNCKFEVISDKWNWIVSPVSRKVHIPARFMEGARILTENNVKFDGIAIAKPKLKEVVLDVIKQKLICQIEILKDVALSVLLTLAKLTKTTVNVIKATARALPEVRYMLEPDPVLLVRVQGKWIEIGRWI